MLPQGSFFGRALERRRLGDLSVVATHYEAGQELPRHAHERPYLVAVAAGAYVESDGGGEHECGPGTLVLNLCGEPHSDRFVASETRVVNVELGPRHVEALSGIAGIRYVRCATASERARRLLAELESDDAVAPLAIEGLVAELLALAARAARDSDSDAPPPWLLRVAAELAERYRDPPTISSLAEGAGVPPSRLARAFVRHRGCTPAAFVRLVRAERAYDAVAGTDLPLPHIASEHGFCDQSHMTRELGRRFGTTPGALRAARGAGRRP